MNRKLSYFLIGVVAVLAGACSDRDAETGQEIYTEVKSVNKLVLSQMTISKMASLDELTLDKAQGAKQILQALGNTLKIGSRKAAYSYDTYMRAYMDFSGFAPDDVKVSGNTVTLTLPAIQTEFAGRDVTINEEHYRVTGIRSAVSASERAEIKEKIAEALKAEVENNSTFKEQLVSTAEAKARAYFTSLLTADEGIENVVVRFKNSND